MHRGDGYKGLHRATLIAVFAVFAVWAPAAAALIVHKPGGHFFGISVRRGTSTYLEGLPGSSEDLSYHGGPVLHSTAPYLIFWLPSGESLPAGAQSLMARYFADVAADSGRGTNVFGVGRQYYDGTGIADYAQTFSAAQVIVDTTPYPATDRKSCPDVNATYYPRCLTDGQLQTEIARVISVTGLKAGNASPTPIFFLVTPADVNVCADSSDCADNAFCSYHSTFEDDGSPVVYASIPFFLSSSSADRAQYAKSCQDDGNSAIEEPNGNLADVAISYMSHEDNETITDPFGTGWWNDATGNEAGDNCIQSFEPAIGGSSSGSLYDQLINGHGYYTQGEWSNGDAGCEMRPTPEAISPQFSVANGGLTPVFDPTPTTSTSSISSARWSFGDGTSVLETGSEALGAVPHTYAVAGTYAVMLSLVDDRGNVASTTESITVGSPPVAAFAFSPGHPLAGTVVSFDSAGTFDGDPGVSIGSYRWDFGDGSTGAGPIAVHTYVAPGTYTVSLTVTNSVGLTRTVVHRLTIAALRIVRVSIRTRRRGAAVFVVVNGAGRLSIGGRTRTATAARTTRLVVWLSSAQLARLTEQHHLTLRARIRFAPRFGPASKLAVTIRFSR